jgi:hypothetical protein
VATRSHKRLLSEIKSQRTQQNSQTPTASSTNLSHSLRLLVLQKKNGTHEETTNNQNTNQYYWNFFNINKSNLKNLFRVIVNGREVK